MRPGLFHRTLICLPLAAMATLCASAVARAAELEEIYDWAVRNGSVRARLTGPALDKWVKVSGTQRPVLLHVKEIEKLQPEGCSRLAVAGVQRDVTTTPQGKREPLEVNWELDYCATPASRVAGGSSGGTRKKVEDYDAGPPSAQRLRNLSQMDAGSHRRKHYADKAIEADMRALGY
jgi:hypothetical protein